MVFIGERAVLGIVLRVQAQHLKPFRLESEIHSLEMKQNSEPAGGDRYQKQKERLVLSSVAL